MSLETALGAILFEDDCCNEKTLPYISHVDLDEGRKTVYAGLIGEVPAGTQVLAVKYTNFDNSLVEHVVKWDGVNATKVMCECGVTMEEFSPTCIVEYQYSPSDPWRLSKVSQQPLEMYMNSKFSQWRQMLDNPTCEAAFVRMLHAGALNKIYDKLAFPIPEEEKAQWSITDEKTGKSVDIPRPVHALRIWNAVSGEYDSVSPLLAGAPDTDEALAAYWLETLAELRKKNGDEYISRLLA